MQGVLDEYIKFLIEDVRAQGFNDWLSPDVMELLVSNYAITSPYIGRLRWEYANSLGKSWGKYVPVDTTLYVSRAKTKNQFKKQVETILHEIQHWNQHAKMSMKILGQEIDADKPHNLRRNVVVSTETFLDRYRRQTQKHGYVKNILEIDARFFATQNLEGAMQMIGKHYGGKLEGGDIAVVVEELISDYHENDDRPLTRLQIGNALRSWDMNSPENMKLVIDALRDAGVKIQ
jgi:hypothetical protein